MVYNCTLSIFYSCFSTNLEAEIVNLLITEFPKLNHNINIILYQNRLIIILATQIRQFIFKAQFDSSCPSYDFNSFRLSLFKFFGGF